MPYNSSQPRDPKGSRTGGRWSSSGGSFWGKTYPADPVEFGFASQDLLAVQGGERYFLFDRKGALIANGFEAGGSVNIPDRFDLEGCTVLHNHPSGTSLSEGDLRTAIDSKLREIRVVNADGQIFAFRINTPPGEAYDAPPGHLESIPDGDLEMRGKWSMHQIYIEALYSAQAAADRAQAQGKLPAELYDRVVYDFAMEKFVDLARRERGFDFSYTKSHL